MEGLAVAPSEAVQLCPQSLAHGFDTPPSRQGRGFDGRREKGRLGPSRRVSKARGCGEGHQVGR